MKTIDLNEQEIEFIIQVINYSLEHPRTDLTTLAIGRNIIKKLLNEE